MNFHLKLLKMYFCFTIDSKWFHIFCVYIFKPHMKCPLRPSGGDVRPATRPCKKQHRGSAVVNTFEP